MYRTAIAIEMNKHDETYREICFKSKKYECVVCGEKEVIDVHHFDENKTNNSVDNLIPLCPTHHRYIHTKRLKQIVVDAIRGVAQR